MFRLLCSSPLNVLSSLLAGAALSVVCLQSAPVFANDGDDKPDNGSEVEQQEKIVLKLSLTDPASEAVTELRQAVKTGESFKVPLEGGASLTIETSAGKNGQVHLGLAYEGANAENKSSTERDCELPGEVNWAPAEGAPAVRVSVRPHHKIKLVLDGDPLA